MARATKNRNLVDVVESWAADEALAKDVESAYNKRAKFRLKKPVF